MTEILFTPEEKSQVVSLVRSQGWALLLKYLFIPELQRANHQTDQPGLDLVQTEFWRGRKFELSQILKFCYGSTGLPNPFDEYFQALLTSLNLPPTHQLTDEPLLAQESEQRGDPRAKRPAFPV